MSCKAKEPATALDEQFQDFACMMDSRRDGTTINLFRSDYWLTQANIIDNRKITLADTGITFKKFIKNIESPIKDKKLKSQKKSEIKKEASRELRKDELTYREWLRFLRDLCMKKNICLAKSKDHLKRCGLPGHRAPPIRPYYYYIPKNKWPDETIFIEEPMETPSPNESLLLNL